jgi:ABC-2 type transport system ATP-binding protein
LEVKNLIHDLKTAGKTIFLSSHILSEVEQMCNRAIIINRGRLVRSGSLLELLGAGDQVEIVADQLPPELEPLLAEWAASFQRLPSEVHITVSSAHKRELVEKLWAAGCDVLSMNTVRGSLEDLYMQLVGNGNPV